MKQRIITFFAVILLLAGLSILLYPTVSNYVQTVKHRRAIFNYLASIEEIDDEEYNDILTKAQEYNARLAENQPALMKLNEQELAEYERTLDITGTGIMGYITIEKADINLPIYHGSSETVLQVGAGHLEGSSLPVGGESAHSLLSGHRGLPSAKLFTNLDKLEEGDVFTIHVLNEFYSYEVDKITVVEPQEVQSLSIEKGKDYCTLITCTPYGVNSHRLLVRGKRVILPEIEEKMAIQSGARTVETLYVIAVVEVPTLIITVIVSVRRRRNRNKQR